MSCRETCTIISLLDQGEWGELSEEVEELKEKGRLALEADSAFSAKFSEVEEKRKDFFRKRFLTLETGLCQTHWHYAGRDVNDIFPLEQLAIVRVEVIRPLPSDQPRERVMCADCITKQSYECPYPAVERKSKGSPTPKQFWSMATDDQIRKLARHFKMPCLRDYTL